MTGGGFGGCAVALVKTDKMDAIMKTIEVEYTKRTGIKPTMFVSRPGQGATRLRG
jgi:galactokinase